VISGGNVNYRKDINRSEKQKRNSQRLFATLFLDENMILIINN